MENKRDVMKAAEEAWEKLLASDADEMRSNGGFVPTKPTIRDKRAFIQGFMMAYVRKFSENDRFECELTAYGAELFNASRKRLNDNAINANAGKTPAYAVGILKDNYKEGDVISHEMWLMYAGFDGRDTRLVYKTITPITNILKDNAD